MDPGQHVVLSIGHITGAVALHCTTLQASLSAQALLLLCSRGQDAFHKAHLEAEARTRANLARQQAGAGGEETEAAS
jgi:hypothetical protein